MRRTMMNEFGVKPLADIEGGTNKLFKDQINLGKDRLEDLDAEIEKATLKNTLSEKSLRLK